MFHRGRSGTEHTVRHGVLRRRAPTELNRSKHVHHAPTKQTPERPHPTLFTHKGERQPFNLTLGLTIKIFSMNKHTIEAILCAFIYEGRPPAFGLFTTPHQRSMI